MNNPHTLIRTESEDISKYFNTPQNQSNKKYELVDIEITNDFVRIGGYTLIEKKQNMLYKRNMLYGISRQTNYLVSITDSNNQIVGYIDNTGTEYRIDIINGNKRGVKV